MARSYNGWPASPNLKTRVIEPVKGCRLRIVDNDNVAAVFTYLVQQFHERVDDVTKPHPADDWGFAYRANRNDPNSLSNHSSGTAIDLDATEHPNGVATSRTFTPKQIAEVHLILKELDGVVRWGGDYTRTVDAMHFEINVKPGGLRKIGRKLRKGKVSPRRLITLWWNVQVGQWQEDMREVEEACRTERPDVVALSETTKMFGHFNVPGYKAHQMKPVRMKKGSQPNTANITILVKDSLVHESFVIRMKKFWKGPKHGLQQDPRTYRWVRVKKRDVVWKLGAFHFPFGAGPQKESITSLRNFFKSKPGRPTIALTDINMKRVRAKNQIANPADAKMSGPGVDLAFFTNCTLEREKNLGKRGTSDHPMVKRVFRK